MLPSKKTVAKQLASWIRNFVQCLESCWNSEQDHLEVRRIIEQGFAFSLSAERVRILFLGLNRLAVSLVLEMRGSRTPDNLTQIGTLLSPAVQLLAFAELSLQSTWLDEGLSKLLARAYFDWTTN